MNKRLLRTKTITEDCERHLRVSNASGSEIESYLTQHILVVFCAEMQQEIYQIVERRVSATGDEALQNYVFSSSRRILRSVKKEDIAAFVAMFGNKAKHKLNVLVNDTRITIYNNAVSNRHDVAHSQGAQITFQELKNSISAAEALLAAVEDSLKRDTSTEGKENVE